MSAIAVNNASWGSMTLTIRLFQGCLSNCHCPQMCASRPTRTCSITMICFRRANSQLWLSSARRLMTCRIAGRFKHLQYLSLFSIYRYKVAAKPVELSPWPTFYERAQNVLAAKEEIDREIDYRKRTGGFSGKFEVYHDDIDALRDQIKPVDYIFTDPPYGGHISYIDLSILWNAWNGTLPSFKDRQRELIVGGDLNLSEDVYVKRLDQSIRTCVALLKPKHWLSVVFQHWSTAYFDAILTAAAEVGGDLRAAISQIGDPVWSMHKKKGKQSVLAGELILTFLKTDKPKTVDANKPFDVEAAIVRILDETSNGTVYGEYLLNRVVVEAWQSGALGSLNINRTDFADMVARQGWSYDDKAHQWRHAGIMSVPLLGRL